MRIVKYKLNAVMPPHRENYETFESFYNQIEKNLRYHQLNPLNNDMILATILLYNIDLEDYKCIIDSGFEYRSFKKIANYANNVLVTDDPGKNMLALFEIYKRMSAVIIYFLNGVYARYEKYKKEQVDKLIKDSDRAVTLCQKYIRDEVDKYCDNYMLEDFLNAITSFDFVREEIASNVNDRVKTEKRQDGRAEENRYIAHIVTSQEKYRRAHRGHKK